MDEILIVLIVIYFIDGLVQDCSNSNSNTLEILQLCTKPALCASTLRPWVMPICFFIVYIVLFQVYSLSDGYQLSPALLIFVYQRNPMTHLSSSNDIINSVNVLPLLNIRTVIHSMTISIMKIRRLWDSLIFIMRILKQQDDIMISRTLKLFLFMDWSTPFAKSNGRFFPDTKLIMMPSSNLYNFRWVHTKHASGHFLCKIYWLFPSTRSALGV